jgi:mono/diheme cytochrome c family protein
MRRSAVPLAARWAAPTLAAAALSASFAWAQSGDALPPAEQGERLAQRWCATCHVIGPAQDMAVDAAPAFVTLAEGRSDEELADWMAAPHAAMPDPGLSRAQIDHLIAYMRSLP